MHLSLMTALGRLATVDRAVPAVDPELTVANGSFASTGPFDHSPRLLRAHSPGIIFITLKL
jgi:hypothetical protein